MDSTGRPEAVELELFTHRFAAIALEMGEMLQRTAVSTNVKERLDFSCALLDSEGGLVVNAPHIPVHLGALGLCVRRVKEALPLAPGDVVVTNHPAFGGSHLPDVTVITPVYADPTHRSAGRRNPASPDLLGYVASRAHHAEIGGIRPGSMPPGARCLAEEGVVISPTHLLRAGEPRWEEIRNLLTAPPHPSRAPEENLADLRAAVAANHRGAESLRNLAGRHGRQALAGAMSALADRAAERLSAALSRLPQGERRALQRLDDGTPLAVRIHLAGGRAELDFAGTGGVHPGNLNAPPAVVQSAVLYCLRLLLTEHARGSNADQPAHRSPAGAQGSDEAPGSPLSAQDQSPTERAHESPGARGTHQPEPTPLMRGADPFPLPLNEGFLRPVTLRVPPGLLDPPFPADPRLAPAVVGGNVETSQRLVDLILAALGLAACSQGTMNNLLFGDGRFGYYETVCGGAGAGPDFRGASAVHTHMTNTRITDPELLEHRYPVRVERFAVRRDSGGAGRFRGGDGVIRELAFLAPMSLSLLTQHRVESPYGCEGGEPGRRGRQILLRASGEAEELAPLDGREVGPGDRLLLETPGGGGWGRAGFST